ncbi:hypothetical protein BTO02_10685 [Paraburkholderia sp. SOS3]|nr:hypothetical protein BTO02_10685 [Paraburkholderia sp. SOS3]
MFHGARVRTYTMQLIRRIAVFPSVLRLFEHRRPAPIPALAVWPAHEMCGAVHLCASPHTDRCAPAANRTGHALLLCIPTNLLPV